MDGGIDDVGLGVLFGLEKYRYEFAGLLMHAEHLEAVHGVGPHTISVPRLKRADDIDPDEFDNGIDDDTFAKIIACIRVAVPYTGMIISTREERGRARARPSSWASRRSPAARARAWAATTRRSARTTRSSSTSPTSARSTRWCAGSCSSTTSPRSAPRAIARVARGDRFMSLCKSGQILNCCHPNALMTLAEYLVDYASPATAEVGLAAHRARARAHPQRAHAGHRHRARGGHPRLPTAATSASSLQVGDSPQFTQRFDIKSICKLGTVPNLQTGERWDSTRRLRASACT